jgi:hypothetical protein
MNEEICVCSRCGLRGYYPTDVTRSLCHLCVDRESANREQLECLHEIRDNFLATYKHERWPGCEFGKAHVGNMILEAIKNVESR